MDVYTIGRLILPGVAVIFTGATLLMVVTLVLTMLRGVSLLRRLRQQDQETSRAAVTINVFAGEKQSRPPMQVKS
jgi:hypothetical protein